MAVTTMVKTLRSRLLCKSKYHMLTDTIPHIQDNKTTPLLFIFSNPEEKLCTEDSEGNI